MIAASYYEPLVPYRPTLSSLLPMGSDIGGAEGNWISGTAIPVVAVGVELVARGAISAGAGALITINNGRSFHRAVTVGDRVGAAASATGVIGGAAFTGVGGAMLVDGGCTLSGAAAGASFAANALLPPLFIATCGAFILYGAIRSREISNFRSEFLAKREEEPEALTKWFREQMCLSLSDPEFQTLKGLNTFFECDLGEEFDTGRSRAIQTRRLDRLNRILGSDAVNQLRIKLADPNAVLSELDIEAIDKASYVERSKNRLIIFASVVALLLIVALTFSTLFAGPASFLLMGLVCVLFLAFMDSGIKDSIATLSWDLPPLSGWI